MGDMEGEELEHHLALRLEVFMIKTEGKPET